MKLAAALATSLAIGAPASAQEARFDWFALDSDSGEWRDDFDGETMAPSWTPHDEAELAYSRPGEGSLQIGPNREPLWGDGRPGFLGRPAADGPYDASAHLDYSRLEDGDVAGLVLRRDADHWLSVQVERIEPADLIAVRLRDGADSPWAGRLVATTALPGSFEQQVSLRIVSADGGYALHYAGPTGDWIALASGIDAAALGNGSSIGLFATDGAERTIDR